jgi:uncharacterized protein YeaO (DUF488 family)
VGEVADYLMLRHHSTVGLVDRAEAAGLIYRSRDQEDHRVVRLHLTDAGAERLEALSALHLEELSRLALEFPAPDKGLAPVQRRHGSAAGPLAGKQAHERPKVTIARAYDLNKRDHCQVLVDRLWSRGVPKEQAPFAAWFKDVAPSAELRRWYGHVPERFTEFSRRYRAELASPPAAAVVDRLRDIARKQGLVLLTATRDVEHSGAAVLQAVIEGRGA